MSRRVHKTARAKADIDGIAHWIAESSGSVDAALEWMSALDERFGRIADAPGTGTSKSEISPGLRSSPFGSYLIFFRPRRGRSVTIVRVVHGGRDLSKGLDLN